MENTDFTRRPVANYSTNTKKRRGKKGRIFKFIFFAVIVCFIFIVVFARQPISNSGSVLGTLTRLPVIKQIRQLVGMENLKGELDDRVNILLLGMGGVGHEGPYLTDTIILASIKPSTGDVAMISLPRDFYAQIPGNGWTKINEANSIGEVGGYEGGGSAFTAQVIKGVFDVPIHYWLRVDFNAFKSTVDALGGVRVCIDTAFVDEFYPTVDFLYQTVEFEAGCQFMDGETALKFVRSRHGTNGEGSDFARAARQQKVILAVKDKIFSLGTLTNPQKIYNLIKTLGDHVQTNIELTQVPHFLDLADTLNSEKIIRIVLDNSPYGLLRNSFTEAGQFILVPRAGSLKEIQLLAQNIFLLKNQSVPPLNLVVLNGTELLGWATGMQNYLDALGFNVIASGNSPQQTYEKSVIYDLERKENSEGIKILKKVLDANVSKYIPEFLNAEEIEGFDEADYLIVLGCKEDGKCWMEDEVLQTPDDADGAEGGDVGVEESDN